MKTSWTNQLRSLKERRSILMYGDIGTEHFVSRSPVKQTQRKAIAKDDYRDLEKERLLTSAVESALVWTPARNSTCSVPILETFFFFFFLSDFRISTGALMIII